MTPLPLDVQELLESPQSPILQEEWRWTGRICLSDNQTIDIWTNQRGDRLTCERIAFHLCVALNDQVLACS